MVCDVWVSGCWKGGERQLGCAAYMQNRNPPEATPVFDTQREGKAGMGIMRVGWWREGEM